MKKYFLILISFLSLSVYFSIDAHAFGLVVPCVKDEGCDVYDSGGQSTYTTDADKGWACMINPSSSSTQAIWTSSCTDGNKVCQKNGCPNSNSNNGAPCRVYVPCYGLGYNSVSLAGTWDASEAKCIACAGPREPFKIGTSHPFGAGSPYIYMRTAGPTYTLQNPDADCLPGTPSAWQTGDFAFESACGADAICDEKNEGDSCGPDKICNVLGKCVLRTCKDCPDADKTKCGACSSKGEFCKNVNNIGTLVSGDEAVANCPNECVKYIVQTNQRYAKGITGPHTDTAEICYDTPTGKDAQGKTVYANWMVDTYINSNRINETQCGSDKEHGNANKCFRFEYGCGQNAVVQDAYVNKDRLPKTTKPIDTTKSFYCAGIPGGSTGGNEPPPGPGPCTTCGDPAVCVGQCVPGDPPKYYADNSCTIATDCNLCGCPPSDYPGTTVTCNPATRLCEYVGPPELPGDPPDCLLSTPDYEYSKTIITTGTYLLSGNNLGTFSGYKWNGTKWNTSNINTGLLEASYSSPAVFFDGNNVYLVSGRGDGGFSGYLWDGTKWVANATINSGLADIGSNSKPAIFYMDGAWNMIAGNALGQFAGFTYSGAGWVSNTSITNNLTDIGDDSAPSVFYKDGIYYMISGEKTGIFYGFYWNGSDWLSDSSIISGLTDAGDNSAPYVYFNNTNMYLITGKDNGQFLGYNWSGTGWQADGTILTGLSALNSRSAPVRFVIDTISVKTMTYSTRFVLESMFEYPSAGSDCYQNKTKIIIPEGHACAMNMSTQKIEKVCLPVKILN